jgi:trk system potassium uptake protein TrkH
VPVFRPILFILGLLLVALAAAMLLPAAIDALRGHQEWQAFVSSAAITGGVGGALAFAYRQPQMQSLTPREGFLLTTLAWAVMCTFATLPFMLSERQMSFTDSFFEAMSGLTTTGSTVMLKLGEAPKGLLLWRALLHLIGGIGIIVMAVAILPVLRVGGMQLFRMESSDKSEKIRPRVSQVSGILISVFFVLTAVCAVALVFAGMPAFDAVCHAISAVATGGFSTQDSSVGYYDSSAIEWIIILFMFLGGCTFVLLARAGQGDFRALWHDSQTRWYFGYIAVFSLAIALWQVAANDRPVIEAVRSSVFAVVSIATTTGFVTDDYTTWGTFPIAVVMMLYFVGGCTGSTTGGIKVFRYNVLGAVSLWQIRLLVHPHRMRPPTYNGKPVSDDVVRSVLSFFLFYVVSFAVFTVAVTFWNIDLLTAASGVAQAMANAGPGLGPIIGPVGTFEPLPDGVIWLLSLAMLLGRLELLTMLVLLSPVFWRG